jgi:hypothetical protein
MHAVNPDDVVVVRHALGRWDVVVVDIADESHRAIVVPDSPVGALAARFDIVIGGTPETD